MASDLAPPRTLTELFFGAVRRFADRPAAMRYRVGDRWVAISPRELLERVRAVSLGLLGLGVRRGDRVALLSENRPEWAVVDYAALALGAADVPIYPTLPARQAAYILRDSGATVVVVSTQTQLDKVLEVRAALPELRHVIAMDPAARGAAVLTLDALAQQGAALAPTYPHWEREALEAAPDDLATLVYTSGTTGDPKGVMLTHGNITSNVVASLRRLEVTPDDECLSFLPLSHIFERMAGHYLMLHAGSVVNYATSIDTVSAELVEVRPTIVCSVPRLYEKIYARVLENARAGSALKWRIFRWARKVGERWVDLRLAGRPVPASLALQRALADRLVFAKLRARTGGRLRCFISGGAPLNPEIARFFHAAGLAVLEGYGLTETSPVITVNTFGELRIGTVGRVIPGVEVRIAEDGEILTRGPNVMQGYYHKPEATAEVLDPDGWFHTGDVGELDADGYLRITDRKKDLIVTAGGKNIAPQPIENLVKTSTWVTNAVMLGDRRKFPIMLVVPNMTALAEWARREQLVFGSEAELLALEEARHKLDREVRRMLRDLAKYETPRKFLFLPRDFTIEAGELTPKLSVRRRVVEERHREAIDALYAETPADA